MTSTNTTPSGSPKPKLTDSAETDDDMFKDAFTARYIKDGKNLMLVTSDNTLVGPLATISPAEILRFEIVDYTKETLGDVLKICNPSRTQNITYKMFSNSPYTYRVTKCFGIIKPEETVEVRMLLRPDSDGTHHRRTEDKFQIKIMEIDNNITEYLDIKRVWDKLARNPAIFMKHKLSCIVKYPKGPELDYAAIEVLVDDLTEKLNEAVKMVDSDSLATKKLHEEQDKVIEELLITRRKNEAEQRTMDEEKITIQAKQRTMEKKQGTCMEEKQKAVEQKQRQTEKEAQRQTAEKEEVQRQQTSISRIVMFQIFIMMLLALAFFVIFYVVFYKEPVEDLSHCSSFFWNPVFPSTAW